MGGKSNILDLFRFLYECWSPQFGPGNALTRRQGIDEVLWKGSQDRVLSIAIQFLEAARLGREFKYELEIAAGAGGYFTIQKETLTLREGGKDNELIVRESDGRWLENADSAKLAFIPAERSGMESAPPNWDGYPLKFFAQSWQCPRHTRLKPLRLADVAANPIASSLRPHCRGCARCLSRNPRSSDVADAAGDGLFGF
jgi:hypothetical protein